jgi:pyruvate/2-oxoglutarate dehydrogenase complex dihydrolipoamide acyltransferase (E2) component
VGDVTVKPGQSVRAGEPLARVGDGVASAPAAGVVQFVDARAGDVVAAGAPLVEIAPTAEPVVGFMAVPARDRARLAPGAVVTLRFEGRGTRETARGTVIRVGDDLLADDRAKKLLGRVGDGEPSVLVVVKLEGAPPAWARAGAAFTVERPTVLGLLALGGG